MSEPGDHWDPTLYGLQPDASGKWWMYSDGTPYDPAYADFYTSPS